MSLGQKNPAGPKGRVLLTGQPSSVEGNAWGPEGRTAEVKAEGNVPDFRLPSELGVQGHLPPSQWSRASLVAPLQGKSSSAPQLMGARSLGPRVCGRVLCP